MRAELSPTELAEQRRFVLWWDGQEKNPGNRGAGRGKHRPSQTTDALKAEDLGLDRDTIHRWRKKLKDERKSEKEALMARAWDMHLNCMSQTEISDAIDVEQRTISNWLEISANLPEFLDPPTSRQHFDIWQF